jgi:hypothetical protein
MSILESFIKSQGGEVIREGESTSDELRSGQVDEPQLEESTEAEEVGNEEQVEDSTGVEETVEDQGDTISFEDTFKEKYGSIEELEEKIRSLTERADAPRLEDDFESDSVDMLKKVLSSGFDWNKLKEIAEVKTLDVDGLSGRQALSKMLEMKDGLSKAEINLKLREYDRLKEEDVSLMDSDEKLEHEAKLAQYERLQRQGKEFLSSIKGDDKYALPELKKTENNPELLEKQQKEYEELKNLYESSVVESVNGFNEINVILGEEEFSFELSDEMKQEVQDVMFNINDYHKNFVGDNGVDFGEMQTVIAKGLYFDEAMRSLLELNTNEGKVEAVKDINNVVDKSKGASATTKNDGMSQIIDGFLKGQGLR